MGTDLIEETHAQRMEFARAEPKVMPLTPMAMIQVAIANGGDPTAVTALVAQLMDLQDRHEKTEARKAFDEAFSAFKGEAIVVLKNKGVTDGPLKGKKYAELFSVVDAVTPMLSKHKLSHSWRLTKDEKDWMEVTCVIKHVQGHSESVTMGGGPDIGGAKNALQARASTLNYLERYTLKAALGLAEKGADDDGNKGLTGTLDAAKKDEFLRAVEACPDTSAVEELWGRAAAACFAARDQDTHAELRAAVVAKTKSFKAGPK